MTTERGGKDATARLRVGVIAGSTRPGRQSKTVAEWVCADPISLLDLYPIDLADAGLPLLSEPTPAAFGQYQQPSTRSWSRLAETFDAFVLVTPEYNHSTSPAMKNALDHLYREWRDKPVAFVGYGLDGGTRAVEHLRAVTAELGMAGVGPQVAISLRADYADGRLEPRSFQSESRRRMLDQLAGWAVQRLVAGLQDGLDNAAADVYDQQFASDVLWGSPYGATLSGYEALNAAHRWLMARAAPPSRYKIVQLMSPLPGVAIAHVRRDDLSADQDQRFSEMAMYVLVQRYGEWWLAAGQNTPITERPA